MKYVKHSATSKEAAELVRNPVGKRAAVLRFIASRGREGATDDEIQIGLDMNASTERPRRIELFEARLICRGLFRRRTRSGRWADAYFVPSFAEPGDHVEFAPVEKPCCPSCGRPF